MQSSFYVMKLQDYCTPANIPSSSASLRLRPTITPSLLMSIVVGIADMPYKSHGLYGSVR